MRFLGLACPGAQGMSALEDLVAVWRVQGHLRFQNYRAVFTILKEETISHAWLQDLVDGTPPADSVHCPEAWRRWSRSGTYSALRSVRAVRPRTRDEQVPQGRLEQQVLQRLFDEVTPREFEFLAAELLPLIDGRFGEVVVTQAVRDGGRDVLARYRVGHDLHQVLLDAYLEAKHWALNSAVGVKPMMRLLARLNHRDIGVFVTTSYFETQGQQELIEDRHPVLLVSGGDIVRILLGAQICEGPADLRLSAWLERIRLTAATGS
jgi:hypothetical protein